jgi:hypothetical protein
MMFAGRGTTCRIIATSFLVIETCYIHQYQPLRLNEKDAARHETKEAIRYFRLTAYEKRTANARAGGFGGGLKCARWVGARGSGRAQPGARARSRAAARLGEHGTTEPRARGTQSAPSRQRSVAARTRGATAPAGRRGEAPPVNEFASELGGAPGGRPDQRSLCATPPSDVTR